jgi:mono/diheme cytochrome c family protein
MVRSMMRMRTVIMLLGTAACLLGINLAAAPIAADSARGAQLFETLACVQCHSVNGKGGRLGPDLGRLVDRNFTPATLAATMWNHAPAMWAAMKDRDIRAGDLDEQGAADLFAYFYAARFFEKPGDAGRGKRAFAERGCAGCHGLTDYVRPLVKPVSQWDVLADPVALAEAMWNHRSRMAQETGAKRVRWPELSAQDLADILLYLRNLPSAPSRPAVFSIGAGSNGAVVFTADGCAACHGSGPVLAHQLQGQTLTEIAAAMWNHAPKMIAAGAKLVKLDPGEMRDLLSYLWTEQFFESSGSASRGARVFEAKHCAGCHLNGANGAPKFPDANRSFNSASMVSALWHHGPRMLAQMQSTHVAWPRFEGTQMADVIAYLNRGVRGGKP